MPRYSSVSFQLVDAPINSADANYRLQSTVDSASTQNVLLLTNENPSIPLYFVLQNTQSTNDNKLQFLSADNGNRAFTLGFDSLTAKNVISSTQSDLVLSNATGQQTISLDQTGNLVLSANATNGSVQILTGTNNGLTIQPTQITLSGPAVNVTSTQNLNVTTGGQFVLNNSGVFTISGDVSFGGSNVTVNTAEMVFNNGLQLNGPNGIYVNGANSTSIYSGSLTVNGSTSLANVTVNGTCALTNGVTISKDTQMLGSAVIAGTNGLMLTNCPLVCSGTQKSSFQGELDIGGVLQVLNQASTTLSGTLTVQQAVTLNDRLTVTGLGGVTISQGSLLLSQGNVNISTGSLTVQNGIVCNGGGFQLMGDLTQSGNISTTGNLTLSQGSVTVSQGTFKVQTPAGVTAFDLLYANAHIGGTLNVDKLITGGNGLTISSGSTILQDLTVQKTLSTTGDASLNGNLTVVKTSTFTGNVTAQAQLNITGGPLVLNNTSTSPSTLQGPIQSYGSLQFFTSPSSTTPLVILPVDGSKATFNQSLATYGQTLDVYAGLNLLNASALTLGAQTSAQFNGSVQIGGNFTVTNGMTISNGLLSITQSGLSIAGGPFTVANAVTSTFNGPVSLTNTLTLSQTLSSSANLSTSAGVIANTFQNNTSTTSATFSVDASGNLKAATVSTGAITGTSATVTGTGQFNRLQNQNNSFFADTNGNVNATSVTINNNVTVSATGTYPKYNVNLPVALPQSNGQALVSDTSGNLSWTNNVASPYPAAFTFSAANNQASSANITNLLFSAAGRSVYIEAVLSSGSPSTKRKSLYILTGWKDMSGDNDWHLRYNSSTTTGNLGLTFSIDPSSSQISYTSQNYASFGSLTFYVAYQ